VRERRERVITDVTAAADARRARVILCCSAAGTAKSAGCYAMMALEPLRGKKDGETMPFSVLLLSTIFHRC